MNIQIERDLRSKNPYDQFDQYQQPINLYRHPKENEASTFKEKDSLDRSIGKSNRNTK